MCKIFDKIMKVPIIQGGMGVGVSLGHLAGAVAKQGGMGVISTVNAGYREPDFESNPADANLRALSDEIEYALAEANGNGIVAINVMVATNRYAETVKCAVESGVQAIISGAGLPMELPKLVEGSSVAIAPIVSSGKAAKIILRAWDKAKHIPDFIVIEGPLAGGHLGFKKEEIIENTAQDLGDILSEVLMETAPYEQKCGRKIPVFVAGGVYDGADIAAFVARGAAGAQIATRFIATEECDAATEYKQMMINASEEDVMIVPSPVGMPGRALRTPLIEKLIAGKNILAKKCNACLKACPHGDKIPYCISHALIEAVKGNVEEGLFFCGANVGRIKAMSTVAELMNELMSEYNAKMKSIMAEKNPA